MDTTVSQENNAVADNPTLRDQLRNLHELLGDEISGIIAKAIEPGRKLSEEAEKALKALSEGASKMTLALMSVRSSKKKLTETEEQDYQRIKELASTLGNLQLKVNNLLKLSKEITNLNVVLKETAISLTEDISSSQQRFREIRSQINDLGLFSQDPDLAFQLSEQRGRPEEEDIL